MSIMRINSNIASVTALRHLNNTSVNLTKTLSRLASGLRITTAADDPAGLIISEQLRGQISSLKAARRNVSEADNYFSIAEAALDEVNRLAIDMRALVTHAANGATPQDQRDADFAAFENAVDSITRILTTTRYSGDLVFTASATGVDYLVGEDPGDTVTYYWDDDGDGTGVALALNVNLAAAGGLESISGWADAAEAAETFNDIGGVAGVGLDPFIDMISSKRGDIGAFQKNVFQTRERTIATQIQNLTAAESNIRDANMAEETANFTKWQILTQAGVAVLAQANVISQNVLQLLG